MPCGCASDTCSCYVVAGPNVEVTGSGGRDNPYVISAATAVINPDGGSTPIVGDPHFTGQIIEFGGSEPPTSDYTACDGKELSRTVYALLFDRLGTTHGAGNGTTTFNVPDYRDAVSVGASGSRPRGTTGGSEEATLTAAMLPPHAHTINHTHAAASASGTHDHALDRSEDTGNSNATIPRGSGTIAGSNRLAIEDDGSHTHPIPAYTGSSGDGPGTSEPVPIMPPFVATPKYIRIQGGP